MFIDYTVIECHSGKGGAGMVSFRREKFIPKGGPNGGDGGKGGDIIILVDHNLHTLHDVRYNRVYKAKNGQQGGINQRSGKYGLSITIPVPPGTIIKDKETQEVIADLLHHNDSIVICKGGKGGKGNQHYNTSTNQTPRYAQPGLPGEFGNYELELKVLADVGLVGFPNAGKSTFLASVSAARPKIADYPFTTLQPHLGIVKYGDFKSFVMADIPGLIEGASEGKGLGFRFLKHIERNKVLVFLIDTNEENPEEIYQTLVGELSGYNPVLLEKPRLIIRSKIDTISDDQDNHWQNVSFPYLSMSSVSHKGVKEVLLRIADFVDEPKDIG
ncbi:MAG: GTPase ObgE [Candidatus Marinimicrobia bacterium]|nr:GTPase ObgE [Candidatus Neomarinimicrobiota bacterium]